MAELPETLEDFCSKFARGSLEEVFRVPQQEMTSEQKAILKSSLHALECGRPLNRSLVILVGKTGSGKSTTINALFDDDNLCPTSSRESKTTKPSLIQKKLKGNVGNQAALNGYLSFVDVPGLGHTHIGDDKTFPSIISFLKSRKELSNRDGRIVSDNMRIRENVFPNLVLLVVASFDNRLEGNLADLNKSLKVLKESNIVDTGKPNLIVVISFAMNPIPFEPDFTRNLNEKREIIQSAVYHILKIPNVPVVPVENVPGPYVRNNLMAREGSYYKLPNGEHSHRNLIHAMMNLFTQNNDFLGELFVRSYFHPECSERQNKAEVRIFQGEPTQDDKIEATRILRNSSITPETPKFNSHYLGQGYCPLTGQPKPVCLLSDKDMYEEPVGDSIFLLPHCAKLSPDGESRHRDYTYYEKEEYEKEQCKLYALEAGWKLAVSGNSRGGFVSSGSSQQQSVEISMDYEIQQAIIRISDPLNCIKNEKFVSELQSLPETYNKKTAIHFEHFFSLNGSHFVYEQGLGGAVEMRFEINTESLSKEEFQKVKANVTTVFRNLTVAADAKGSFAKYVGKLTARRMKNSTFRMYGGQDLPEVVTAETLTSERLNRWKKQLPQKPRALESNLKLFPYYNLLSHGSRKDALKEATKDYLQAKLNNDGYALTRGCDAFEFCKGVVIQVKKMCIRSLNKEFGSKL